MTMKNQAIFLFLILLVGLLLASFLGGGREGFEVSTYTGVNNGWGSSNNSETGGQGNVYTGPSQNVQNDYDNYNHYHGSSYPTMYYGPNGGNAKLVFSNGIYSVIVTDASGNSTTFGVNNPNSSGSSNSNNSSNNSNSNNSSTNSNSSSSSNSTSSSNTTYYSQNGGQATISKINGVTTIQVVDAYGNNTTYSSQNPQTYNTSSNDNYNNNNSTTPYYGYGTSYNSNYTQTSGSVSNPSLNSSPNASQNPYASTLPKGIPKSQILPGQEDLYILKSEVVPPVCPACPTSTACPRQEPCPACPPCGRCPEPAITCKAVPNYNAISSEYLPQPVLNSFSSFGM
jgi:hypothetical protein